MIKLELTNKMKVQLACVCGLFFIMLYIAVSQHISLGQRYQKVIVNDTVICSVNGNIDLKELEQQIRRELAAEYEDKLAIDCEITSIEERKPFVSLAWEGECKRILKEEMKKSAINQTVKGYTVAIGDYRATFKDIEDLKCFFSGVKASADVNMEYEPVIKKEDGHIRGTMTAVLEPSVSNARDIEAMLEAENEIWQEGILDIEFIDQITIYENFVQEEEIADAAEQISEVTKEKETNKIYIVKSGDSLSVIAYENDTTVASIVALNGFKNKNVIIGVGDELIIAVPEPDLKLRVKKGEIYEEDYTAEPTIIPNDTWYTTQEVVHDAGTVGHRQRNDMVTMENGLEVGREMLCENIIIESEPAVIERGTVIPPTYIKPLNGGRKTSGYGRRWGRLHKGVDWACPVGTTVFASSAGTVIRADYNGSYGNCVLISHPDGKMTRYAHNSKLLVSAGQHVEQGEAIALSGNTGRSTGPHVHFEIIVNGSAVDPLKYIY